jgi:hypothetical protein
LSINKLAGHAKKQTYVPVYLFGWKPAGKAEELKPALPALAGTNLFPNELLSMALKVPCRGLPELPTLDVEEDKLLPGAPPTTVVKPAAVFAGPLLDIEADMLLIWYIALPLGPVDMPPGPVVWVVVPPGIEFRMKLAGKLPPPVVVNGLLPRAAAAVVAVAAGFPGR